VLITSPELRKNPLRGWKSEDLQEIAQMKKDIRDFNRFYLKHINDDFGSFYGEIVDYLSRELSNLERDYKINYEQTATDKDLTRLSW